MKTVELKALEVMEINAECRNIIEVGGNEAGYQKVFQITGGDFQGEGIRGRVVPCGADWNIKYGYHGQGYVSEQVYAKYILETQDGVHIVIENRGMYPCGQDGEGRIRTSPSFFAPAGAYEYLNYGVYAAELHAVREDNGIRVRLVVYRLL